MAAEIGAGWAPVLISIELRSGSKGVFKVSVDGKSVFDKAETGRFPNSGEISQAVEASLGKRLAWRKSHQ